jgi:Uma2 family endonuclease
MSAPAVEVMTAEAFWALPDAAVRRELVNGEVVELMPPGGKHGLVAASLSWALQGWARVGKHGVVGVESGFVLRREPDTVRAPDVFFVRAERVPAGGVPEAFWNQAPDLAVEIVSPSETAEEVRAKVRDYLAAGAAMVWEIHPRTREVLIHTPDNTIRALGVDATIGELPLLPGFTCAVRDLFAF